MSWTTVRGAGNRGAGSGATRRTPAAITASWPTGADVRQVVEFRLPSGEAAALIVAGSCVQAMTWHGEVLWTDFHSITTQVMHVAHTGTGPIALLLSRDRDARLVDLVDGRVGWRYQAPAGTNLSGPGSAKLVPDGDGWRWIVAPSYSESITCFDIRSATDVRQRWVHDFAGRYDRGFGPVMVVADVLGDGGRQLLISSRTGSSYGDGDADVPTERVVLGRADGHLYQAVLDLDDGHVLAEVAYRPDPGDYPCARPYGLLQVVDAADARLAVLVSCQVEEYYSVTRIRDGVLSRAWGEFVEKDWPVDEQELRPQISSVVSPDPAVSGDPVVSADSAVSPDPAGPLLVTGHFGAGRSGGAAATGTGWTTVIRRADTGERVGAVPGHYFWGTVRTDAGDLAILSPAVSRQLAGTEPLRAARVDDPAKLSDSLPLRPVTCSTNPLPADVSFHAERRSLVTVADAAGRTGILATTVDQRLCWWDPADDEVRVLADLDVVAGYPGLDGVAMVVTRDGTVHRVDADLRVAARLVPVGRRPEAFAAVVGGTGWVLSPTGGGATEVRAGGDRWTVPGRVAAIAVPAGTLLAATITGSGEVLLYRSRDAQRTGAGSGGLTRLCAITPAGTPTHACFIEHPDRVLVSERTGVHTAAIAVYELDGRLVWRDAAHGPHPNLPMAAADREGRWRVAYDDHGDLLVRDAHTGDLLAERDWTAAYTTPALVSSSDRDCLVRLGGVHGIEAVDLDLSERWRYTATLWRYFPGEAAIGARPGGPVIANASAEGVVDLIELATGRLLRTVDIGPVAARPPLVAVDVDADGYHEFVVGTAAGRLVTIDPDRAEVRPWPVALPAAIEYLAVADTRGDGFSDLIVGTADGTVHVVSGTEPRG